MNWFGQQQCSGSQCKRKATQLTTFHLLGVGRSQILWPRRAAESPSHTRTDTWDNSPVSSTRCSLCWVSITASPRDFTLTLGPPAPDRGTGGCTAYTSCFPFCLAERFSEDWMSREGRPCWAASQWLSLYFYTLSTRLILKHYHHFLTYSQDRVSL